MHRGTLTTDYTIAGVELRDGLTLDFDLKLDVAQGEFIEITGVEKVTLSRFQKDDKVLDYDKLKGANQERIDSKLYELINDNCLEIEAQAVADYHDHIWHNMRGA